MCILHIRFFILRIANFTIAPAAVACRTRRAPPPRSSSSCSGLGMIRIKSIILGSKERRGGISKPLKKITKKLKNMNHLRPSVGGIRLRTSVVEPLNKFFLCMSSLNLFLFEPGQRSVVIRSTELERTNGGRKKIFDFSSLY